MGARRKRQDLGFCLAANSRRLSHPRFVWCILFILSIAAIDGLEIHLQKSSPAKSIVFDSTLTGFHPQLSHPSCHVQSATSLRTPLLVVKGSVILTSEFWPLVCSILPPTCNPLRHSVDLVSDESDNAKASVNRVRLSLLIFVEGCETSGSRDKTRQGDFFNTRRGETKLGHELIHHLDRLSHLNNRHLHRIDIRYRSSSLRQKPCFSRDEEILDLRSFLPAELQRCLQSAKAEKRKSDDDMDSNLLLDSNGNAALSVTSLKLMALRSFGLESNGKRDLVFRFPVGISCVPIGDNIQLTVSIFANEPEFSASESTRTRPVSSRSKTSSPHQRFRRAARAGINTKPQFEQNFYLANIKESEPVGTLVTTMSAFDPDSGLAGKMAYSFMALRDGRSKELFDIDEDSGRIVTIKELDRETMPEHQFRVTARDFGSPRKSATATLTVKVNDVNDHAPLFESSVYNRDVLESTEIGTTIITLRATDNDEGRNAEIEYSLLNPNSPNEAFKIDPIYGEVTTQYRLDREKIGRYRLEIVATDKASDLTQRKSATAVVNINVKDVNDNVPQFDKRVYSIDVDEDANWQASPVILTVTATDSDEGANSEIRYSLSGSFASTVFRMDSLTGKISLVQELDFESVPRYELSVRAQDQGSPARANTTDITINVIDVNDNAPQFYMPAFEETITEEEDSGQIITTLQAYDRDSGPRGEIEYSIRKAPANMPIVIDKNTGVMKTTRRIDREESSTYSFTVVAKDKGEPPLSAVASMTIKVRDINDNSPTFSEREYQTSIAENANYGTPVITISALDKDENPRVNYAITAGNARNCFQIRSQAGQGLLSLTCRLDYKKEQRFVLTVRATDEGGRTDQTLVKIEVLDANTHRPHFDKSLYSVKVSEEEPLGTLIFTALATDADVGENARLTYSIYNSDQVPLFKIDPDSGEITTTGGLDRETMSAYTIQLQATDNGKPSKSDTADLQVEILDTNDNSPVFDKSSYLVSISEDIMVDRTVVKIHAKDKDAGLNGRVRYTFTDGDNGNGNFAVDPSSGVVRISKKLDRETVAAYRLIAYAVDRGGPPRSSSVIIQINVQDSNDNAPIFRSDILNEFVKENSPIGTVVGMIYAKDPDLGDNARVEYSIVGGPDMDFFELDAFLDPTPLKTLIEFDYEAPKKRYEIQVRAASDTLYNEATVYINILDENDNAPQLKDFNIVFNNFESYFPTKPIGRVPAFDPDANDTLLFEISQSLEFILLDNRTGEITLNSNLNTNVPISAPMSFQVSDGENVVKASAKLDVLLVTDEMLSNSITVRLANMTAEAFLSPVYRLFKSALSVVVECNEKDIFVFSVNNDTEVGDQRILNVSFSATKPDQTYFSSQYLRERIYLQRERLTKLSSVEVLPFDDNLCVHEPCPNNAECLSVLKFGNAAEFIASDTFLFRPIYPVNTFKCRCPDGFTGKKARWLCDTEVNLCYSNPCANNGTCIRKEGGYSCLCPNGFTGVNCQVDMTNGGDICETNNPCRRPSQCQKLITGQIVCVNCPHTGKPATDLLSPASTGNAASGSDFNRYCELTTRHFPANSYLTFPSLKQRHRFNIRFEFSTHAPNGLLFYNGRYNEKHDFIATEIIEGQIVFSFSLGQEGHVTRVTPNVAHGVNDGEWRYVEIDYLNRTATVTVGEECDTGIAVKFNKDNMNNPSFTCARREERILDPKCHDDESTCYRFLDLTGPLQFGGLPNLPGSRFKVSNKDFRGCIRDLHIDRKFVDLNSFVHNNGTAEGCSPKSSHCQNPRGLGTAAGPCLHGGTCFEAWGTFRCECPESWGGKDCSQAIERPRHFRGNSYLKWQNPWTDSVTLPFYMSLDFRAHDTAALLMRADIGSKVLRLEIVDGSLRFRYGTSSLSLSGIRINDGRWHHANMLWDSGKIMLSLDYSTYGDALTISTLARDSISGQKIGNVWVGGINSKIGGSLVVNDGFIGCASDFRLGNSENAILPSPQEKFNVISSCLQTDACSNVDCPANSVCEDLWGQHRCVCRPGFIGEKCEPICQKFNPCHHESNCTLAKTERSYTCSCDKLHEGDYCEEAFQQPCPASWWGYPVCGPCNCNEDKGQDPVCDKKTGNCSCKANHYKPLGSDTCFPCDCYSVGSLSFECEPITGQCACRQGVIGRRCDQCGSKSAEIINTGCKVIYDQCPKSFNKGIWWLRTDYGTVATQRCPKGTFGLASRACTDKGWLIADTVNCTSMPFKDSKQRLEQINGGQTLTNFVSRSIANELKAAGSAVDTDGGFFAADVDITRQLLLHVLKHESLQKGLDMSHTQDKNFIQNLLDSASRILAPEKFYLWQQLKSAGKQKAEPAELLQWFEHYSRSVTLSHESVHTTPFDVVTPNIVFGLDVINLVNFTGVSIPKYNNFVMKKEMFDKKTKVTLQKYFFNDPVAFSPDSSFRPSLELSALANNNDKGSVRSARIPKMTKDSGFATLGYFMFRTLGDIMPKNYKIKRAHNNLDVNTPLFSLNILHNGKFLTNSLELPVLFDFLQQENNNRSSPQCVYWDGIRWNDHGCLVKHRRELVFKSPERIERYVTCECDHLTTFAALYDMSDKEYEEPKEFAKSTVIYIGVGVSLFFLSLCLIIFCCISGLKSNVTSIHKNLVLSILIAEVVFLIGHDIGGGTIWCKVVAIALHYFFLCAFAWMFIEGIHLYRMMTDKPGIDHGQMHFYYAIGYGLPAIIVGLAVGLRPDAYGQEFCWLSINEKIIWSFAGPICLVVFLNLVVFIVAFRYSCNHPKSGGKGSPNGGDAFSTGSSSDFAMIKTGLKAAFVLLPILGITWVFGLLAVNKDIDELYYLFAAFMLLQGLLIFLCHIVFNKRVRHEIVNSWARCRGRKPPYEESTTTGSRYLRSALAYNNASVDGLANNRLNLGISTNSTTSRSTSKTSTSGGTRHLRHPYAYNGPYYKPDGYFKNALNTSTSTNDDWPPPTGNHVDDPDTGEVSHKREQSRQDDSDSDSELSLDQRMGIELASSHSSDEDDNEFGNVPGWQFKPKNKVLDRVRQQGLHENISPGPENSGNRGISPVNQLGPQPHTGAPPMHSTPKNPGEPNFSAPPSPVKHNSDQKGSPSSPPPGLEPRSMAKSPNLVYGSSSSFRPVHPTSPPIPTSTYASAAAVVPPQVPSYSAASPTFVSPVIPTSLYAQPKPPAGSLPPILNRPSSRTSPAISQSGNVRSSPYGTIQGATTSPSKNSPYVTVQGGVPTSPSRSSPYGTSPVVGDMGRNSPYGTIQGAPPSPARNSPFGTVQGISASPYAPLSLFASKGLSPSHQPNIGSRPAPPPVPPPMPPPLPPPVPPAAPTNLDASFGSLSDNNSPAFARDDPIPHIDSSMSDAAITPVAAAPSVPSFPHSARPALAPKPKPPSRPGDGAGPKAAASPDRVRVLTHNGSISSDDSEN